MKISLFIPCLVDQAAPLTARATVSVLERLGHQVNYNPLQTCCGQALFNAGFRAEAGRLAQRFIRIFASSEVVVAPSGSCVGMVKLHYEELDLPASLKTEWESLRERVWEFTSFLVDRLQVTDVGAEFPHRVRYHPSCHLTRDLGVVEAPLKLLRTVKGMELLEDGLESECCGFGGAFSAKYAALSEAMADRRASALALGQPQYVTGADDSCLHHLSEAFRRLRSPVRTLHIARILAGTTAAESRPPLVKYGAESRPPWGKV